MTGIRKETNGTLIRLQPQKAYTKDYNKLLDVAMEEQESNKWPTLAWKGTNVDTDFFGKA